jgi:dolichol-phosphate mannosyltransferase
MATGERFDVSVIIPTYKEAENLPLLVPEVAEALERRGWRWQVIVVDDNSTDATPEVLNDLAARYPGQFAYRIRTDERGLSSAVVAGLAMAGGDVLVVMDADLSHPPERLPALVDFVRDGAEFVIGSRYVHGGRTEDWSRLRWLNSAGATLLSKPLVGPVKDPMAGFFALPRKVFERAISLNPIGYKIGLELIVKCGISTVAEVPIVFRNRIHGESKLTLKEQFRYLEHLSRLYDAKYPKGSPRVKFLIAAGCGAVADAAVLWGLTRLGVRSALALAAGIVALILVTTLFFIRYVRTQRAFLVIRRPYLEFAGISLVEFAGGWGNALAWKNLGLWGRAGAGVFALLVARYALRKIFQHDIRGIRGVPKPAARRVVVAPITATPRPA